MNERHRRLSRLVRRGAIHLAGAAGVTLVILLSWRGYERVLEEQAMLQEEQRTAAELLRSAAPIRARHASLKQEMTRLDERRQTLDARRQGPPDDAALMAQVSDLTRDCELALKEFRPTRTGNQAVEVHVSLTGPYAGICRFLDGMSDLPKPFRVVAFDLTSPRRSGDPCGVELTLRANVVHINP